MIKLHSCTNILSPKVAESKDQQPRHSDVCRPKANVWGTMAMYASKIILDRVQPNYFDKASIQQSQALITAETTISCSVGPCYTSFNNKDTWTYLQPGCIYRKPLKLCSHVLGHCPQWKLYVHTTLLQMSYRDFVLPFDFDPNKYNSIFIKSKKILGYPKTALSYVLYK